MRLGISNIAWDVAEDAAVLALLRDHGIDAIDIAPGKYFPEPRSATEADMLKVRRWWSERGIEITGMQALLFGKPGLNVFGSTESRQALSEQLGAVCRIGGVLGATRLVFGSPRNRDRTGLTDADALDVALEFFQGLGDRAAQDGVIVCLEPNPVRYGANFMTTSEETARVVRALGHPAIRMQLDIGAVVINNENPEAVVAECASLIGHIHASEPDLAPLGSRGTDHRRMADVLREHLAESMVCIEMVATADESHLESIGRALKVAVENYRGEWAEGAR
ncbi:sugar phosphate isomerase/epimerase family protein [Variovorax gossypii]